jgi:pimeloyl-ACP methyl ester carboxylesterase
VTQPPLPTIVRGSGDPVVLLHGFAIVPATYARTVAELATRARVLMPMWMYVEGPWSYEAALDGLDAILDALGVEQARLVGHSAGGAIALGYAARRPERVSGLALVDTLGASDARSMRRNALPGRHLARLASLAATRDFFGTVLTRPRDLGRAAMWAYRHVPSREIERVRELAVDRHVIWSESDVLLSPDDGERFARLLDATFTLVTDPDGGGGIDHDWAYRHPRLFVETLTRLRVLPGPAS